MHIPVSVSVIVIITIYSNSDNNKFNYILEEAEIVCDWAIDESLNLPRCESQCYKDSTLSCQCYRQCVVCWNFLHC